MKLNPCSDVELLTRIVDAFIAKHERDFYLPGLSMEERLRGVVGTVVVDFCLLQDGAASLSDFVGPEDVQDG